ncbi:hypothetical protein D9M68_896070 [compost metagenome]
MTEPETGDTSCRTESPVVDLPQPDSPTSDRVSPRCREKETFSTACTRPETLLQRPERIAKRVVRFLTSSTGGPSRSNVSTLAEASPSWPVLGSAMAKRRGRGSLVIEPSLGTAESSALV